MKPAECFYLVDTVYSITINPENRYQYFLKPDRIKLCKKTVESLLYSGSGVLHNITYTLHMEISEPRGALKNGYDGARLHFHGIVSFPHKSDILYFLMVVQRMLCKIGNIKIDTCPDIEVWHKYCAKQKLLDVYPIIINWK